MLKEKKVNKVKIRLDFLGQQNGTLKKKKTSARSYVYRKRI